MQTVITAKPPVNKIKKRYFFGALLMSCLLSSAVILPYKVSSYIEMVGDFCLEPFGGKDRVLTTKLKILKDYSYELIFSVSAWLENGELRNHYNFSNDFGYSYGWGYFTKGTELPYTFRIKKELFEEGDITRFSLLWKFEEFERTAPDAFELFIDDVIAGSITHQEINSKMLPFRRDKEITYASYFYGSGFFSSRRYYAFDGSGFKDEYVSDHYGIVPLSDMHFTPTYYSSLSEKLSMSSGELQILNYLDDFDIGEIRENASTKKKYRSIPLELVYKNGYSYLRPKETYYVSKDLRYQTSVNHKGQNGWYETKQIFLPPVKGFEARNYQFNIIMNDTGECNMDRFTHSFKVIRTANVYGSKYNSDFFVKEILDV